MDWRCLTALALSVPHEKPNPVQKLYEASYRRKSAPYICPGRQDDHEESSSFKLVFMELQLSHW